MITQYLDKEWYIGVKKWRGEKERESQRENIPERGAVACAKTVYKVSDVLKRTRDDEQHFLENNKMREGRVGVNVEA